VRTVLTIAGSDSSGGAGSQLDLAVFAALGLHGAAAVTALTAQNSQGVQRVFSVPPSFVAAQIDAVVADFPVRAVKIGMLQRPQIVHRVAERIKRRRLPNVVLDPVIKASDGASLLSPRGVKALRESLLPLATVTTPNLAETEALSGVRIRSDADLPAAAEVILKLGAAAVIITGGHRAGAAVDTLYTAEGQRDYPEERLEVGAVHGTGCAFSSALAGYLARGSGLPEAVAEAKAWVTEAIRHSAAVGRGARFLLPALPPGGGDCDGR